ncbi:MAG: hypothetical protein P8P74_10150 [Crocinitomicaceae bacterium]|nr:hypothetical protein [Crocinitomicaceae bacterium]
MKNLLVIASLLCSMLVLGQNLDKIGEENPVTVSGGMSSNFVVNNSIGQPQYRDPFNWVLSGNVTVNVLDVSLPFTFSFSNAGNSYTQPFNMTALHPTYKDWNTHFGITSMNFSQYTYSGLNFAGAGVEYSPEKWHFKAFGGRLKKAIEFDPSVNNIHSVSYKRMGFGFSTAYKAKDWGTELIIFKAYDDGTSLQYDHKNPELTVRDNIVISLISEARLFKTLQLKAEIASSLLTQDVLVTDTAFKTPFYGGLVRGNQTTSFSNAYNASIDYRKKSFGVGLKYERIDPEYSTLGAIYFNNDLENITLNPSMSLFKNKVNLALSAGYQRNNLANTNASDNKRWIGSANVSAQIIQGLSFNASYSNMSSFTRRNPQADPFFNQFGDTLNFYQVSQNISSSLAYSFGDSIKQSMNLTGTFAQSQNITGRLDDAGAFGLNVGIDTTQTPVDVYNAMFGHRLRFKTGLSLGWTFNANHSIAMGNTNSYIGPGINVGKSLLDKKMTLSVATTYNRQFQNTTLSNHVLNFRTSLRYSPEWWDKKYGKLSMSLNGNFTNRLPVIGATKNQNLMIIANIGIQF